MTLAADSGWYFLASAVLFIAFLLWLAVTDG